MGNCASGPLTVEDLPPLPKQQEPRHVQPTPPLVDKGPSPSPGVEPANVLDNSNVLGKTNGETPPATAEAVNSSLPSMSNVEDSLFPPTQENEAPATVQPPPVAQPRTEPAAAVVHDPTELHSTYEEATEPESESKEAAFFALTVYKYKELQKATQNFKDPEMVLGEGGFGKVYKGWLRDVHSPETYPVAIKKLNSESFQGQQEWLAEIVVLGKLRHPNLVRLLGYSSDQGEGLLVYEFLAMGSLDYHLFRKEGEASKRPPLPWELRLQIALQAAQGLTFLHDNGVIHRDFKAPNILLDEKFTAKIADFGLAKGAPEGQTHITTRIMGTMGYLDPKYMETGQLTKKSDVYAFGVLLLELLTGRRAVIETDEDSITLAKWAAPLLQLRRPDIATLIDPSIRDSVQSKQAQKAVHKFAISARHCIEKDPNSRPYMGDLVDTLRPLLSPLQGSGLSGSFAQDPMSGGVYDS